MHADTPDGLQVDVTGLRNHGLQHRVQDHARSRSARRLALSTTGGAHAAPANLGAVDPNDPVGAYGLSTSYWLSHVIPVCWENPTNADLWWRALAQAAVEETWQKHSALTFTGWGACVAGVAFSRVAKNARSSVCRKGARCRSWQPCSVAMRTMCEAPNPCGTRTSKEDPFARTSQPACVSANRSCVESPVVRTSNTPSSGRTSGAKAPE